MQQVVKGWGANRTTERENIRYLLNERESMRQQIAEHKRKERDQDKKIAELTDQGRMLLADNGAKDITIMNQTAKLANLLPLKVWAWVGKGTVIVIGVGVIYGVVTLVKNAAP